MRFDSTNVGEVHVSFIKYEGRAKAVGAYRTAVEAALKARSSLMTLLIENGFDRETALDALEGQVGEFEHYVVTTSLFLPY